MDFTGYCIHASQNKTIFKHLESDTVQVLCTSQMKLGTCQRKSYLPIGRPIYWYRAIQSERLYVNKVSQSPHPSVSESLKLLTGNIKSNNNLLSQQPSNKQ